MSMSDVTTVFCLVLFLLCAFFRAFQGAGYRGWRDCSSLRFGASSPPYVPLPPPCQTAPLPYPSDGKYPRLPRVNARFWQSSSTLA